MHGDLLERGRVLSVGREDLFDVTDVVRLSLLRFIALSRVKTKAEVMRSLDHAMFDSRAAEELEVEVEEHWRKRGADLPTAIDVDAGVEGAR